MQEKKKQDKKEYLINSATNYMCVLHCCISIAPEWKIKHCELIR